jgi:hypothetical protein
MSDQLQDSQNQREVQDQDPEIRIEGLDDLTRQGYVQIPNYFKYYWTPLIGYKAAAVYEMILSFAHGKRDTCSPSLNQLCAHLGMTRKELTGRKRKIRAGGKKIKEYYEQGQLEILQEHALLTIETHGNSFYTLSYTFKVLKTPPFLTPEQLSRLPEPVRESHQRLIERYKAKRQKAHNFQAFKDGGDIVTRGVVTLSQGKVRKGGDNVTTNKTTTINRTTTELSPLPPEGAVVVVSVPITQGVAKPLVSATSGSDAGALLDIPTKNNTPRSSKREGTSAPALPLPLTLSPSSFFASYLERIVRDLVPRYGTAQVQEAIDILEATYSSKKPPDRPLSLLSVSLKRGNLIPPEGYKSREEREAERRQKELREAEKRAAEEQKHREEEARRLLRAYSDTLFEALPPERKEPYLRQAAQGIPSFLAQGPWLEAEAERIFFEEMGARLALAALSASDQDPAGEGLTGPNLCEGHLRHEDQTFVSAKNRWDTSESRYGWGSQDNEPRPTSL